MAKLALPAGMFISGGAADSGKELLGHGMWWDSQHLAELAGAMKGTIVVRNHDDTLNDVAGVITQSTADRYEVSIPNVQANGKPTEPQTYTKEMATNLKYQAALDASHPSYKQVATHVMSLMGKGATPHVSMAIAGTGYLYDEATDRLILAGPYHALHLGVVTYGASQPSGGVGIFQMSPIQLDIAPPANAAAEVSAAYREMPRQMKATASILIANAADLWIDLAEKRGFDDPIVLRAAVALGIDRKETKETLKAKATAQAAVNASLAGMAPDPDEDDGEKGAEESEHPGAPSMTPDAPAETPAPSSPPAAAPAETREEAATSYQTAAALEAAAQGANKHMADTPPNTPPASAPIVDAQVLEDLKALKAKVAAFDEERAVMASARLDARRAEMANATGLPLATFAAFKDDAALDAASKIFASNSAVAIRQVLSASAPAPEGDSEKARKSFLAAMAAGKEWRPEVS